MINRISSDDLAELKEQLKPLIGQRFRSLSLPIVAIAAFEVDELIEIDENEFQNEERD
ncbi:hypothetical protein [Nostoc sp. NMS4]|uniref:hypothetical protein n=1 Tax=Nostoc sp. NMS4 TaxID=2815390 RepID=UPI0025F5F1D8|nr:hypothetical protein [Nostoc sp. NMS4]MBN3927499.1 hypothetical protein [Nostoc sp. NMS4]